MTQTWTFFWRNPLKFAIICWFCAGGHLKQKIISKKSWSKCNFFFRFWLLHVHTIFASDSGTTTLHVASSLICANSFLRQFSHQFFFEFYQTVKKKYTLNILDCCKKGNKMGEQNACEIYYCCILVGKITLLCYTCHISQ